ncbi:uncharacterized protein LOC131927026 [Physella acuta]|uniref:uncharacterized protein LOC131927026 n=1 Tax=Physella acuta TaxID=109671 RepID=UPI0027DE4820|nr:uncharacterized protein LOC131927026 [Physella acuta]XP_059138667.1 uncharacterized protein LOC131927026 [Physella acuta]XP_059138668.1 uncharacterized protein LOC131927026 [Physella acuta]
MTHLEMRTLDMHYDPDETEMSAQERLLYNNNYNSNHHHLQMNGDEEPHYQLPYAHLHQSPYLHHQQQLQQQQGSYSSDDHSSIYNPRHINGHGITYPQGTLQDKYSVAYPVRDDNLGRRGNRPTGSGIVYRPRRKLWWVAALLVLLLLVIAGAVVIAVYFTVLKKEPVPATVVDNGASVSKNKSTPRQNVNSRVDGSDTVTQQPPYNIPYTSPYQPSRFVPDVNDIKIQKFDAYWNPGDSRLFTAVLTNGTMIQAFGAKRSDGRIKSLYSLGLSNMGGAMKLIRFLEQRNFASVVLANGVIVNYDWAASGIDMEVKVYEPYTEKTKGPISHLTHVEIGFRSYLLRQVSKVMADIKELKHDPNTGSRPGSAKCFTRYPLKVSKGGGNLIYEGAFVLGEISGIDKPMAALPWPKEPEPCYENLDAKVQPNYYLPLPGEVENEKSVQDAYTASSAEMFTKLCLTINDHVKTEYHTLCSDMAVKVRNSLNHSQLHDIVYESCTSILNALHLACFSITRISAADNMPTLDPIGLIRSFERRLSNSFQTEVPSSVDIKAHAFCPSSLPTSSFQNTVDIINNRGAVIADMININCPDYPEVTKVDVFHLLAKSDQSPSYDLVRHKIAVCSTCAFEKSISLVVIDEFMMCNDTCSHTNVREKRIDQLLSEEKTFSVVDAVYCHNFLTDLDMSLESPIRSNCLGNCFSHMQVRLQIRDPKTNVLFYDQTVGCNENKNFMCINKFGA